MNQTLQEIKNKLQNVVSALYSAIPQNQDFGAAHSNWSFPSISSKELVDTANIILKKIDNKSEITKIDKEEEFISYISRLDFLINRTIPNIWNNPNAGVSAYYFTMFNLNTLIDETIGLEANHEIVKRTQKALGRLRGLEAKLKSLDPRISALSEMMEHIESAHDAAERLPLDLESLIEARSNIDNILITAQKFSFEINSINSHAIDSKKTLDSIKNDAEQTLDRCQTAYAASTSIGLAAAFSERSAQLSRSMWIWVTGLILSLLSAGIIGAYRINILIEILDSKLDVSQKLMINSIISIISIGAPIWFAWLATKQIGQRFKLAEDYAFKASISRAYEGFRREAARHGGEMEARLLASALTRIDEQPIRFVENTTHGSPIQELLNADSIKKALDKIPNFSEQLKIFAEQSLIKRTEKKEILDNIEKITEK